MYSMEVIKAQKEFEDITDARIVIQHSQSVILFYFKKEEFMQLSRESNVTQKHLQIYRFVSKSQNDLGRLGENDSIEQKPLFSEQRRESKKVDSIDDIDPNDLKLGSNRLANPQSEIDADESVKSDFKVKKKKKKRKKEKKVKKKKKKEENNDGGLTGDEMNDSVDKRSERTEKSKRPKKKKKRKKRKRDRDGEGETDHEGRKAE